MASRTSMTCGVASMSSLSSGTVALFLHDMSSERSSSDVTVFAIIRFCLNELIRDLLSRVCSEGLETGLPSDNSSPEEQFLRIYVRSVIKEPFRFSPVERVALISGGLLLFLKC